MQAPEGGCGALAQLLHGAPGADARAIRHVQASPIGWSRSRPGGVGFPVRRLGSPKIPKSQIVYIWDFGILGLPNRNQASIGYLASHSPSSILRTRSCLQRAVR